MFLLGAAPLVSASPVREENTERVSYNERRANAVKPNTEPGWIELASATPASHGREFVEVGADAGAFTRLRLTAASGRSGIRAIRVDYQDGTRHTFEIERVLSPKSRPVYVDLRGARELRQVIVMTDRDTRGSYRLEGDTSARESGVATR